VPCATRQALSRGEAPAKEIDRLLLHGYLHLLGYDHEVDKGKMERLEARLRERLGIAEA
jgi:probable rRNA maturation factor